MCGQLSPKVACAYVRAQAKIFVPKIATFGESCPHRSYGTIFFHLLNNFKSVVYRISLMHMYGSSTSFFQNKPFVIRRLLNSLGK